MADPSPSAPWAAASSEVSVALVEPVQIVSIAARKGKGEPLADRLRDLLRLEPPVGPRCTWAGDTSLLGVGPGRWLAVRDGASPVLYDSLALELAGLAAVCDQGDGYAVFHVEGPAARRVLAKGAPVDLHPQAFGPHAAAATLVAHMNVILWLTEAGYRIAVFRSHGASFWHWLQGAAAEFLVMSEG